MDIRFRGKYKSISGFEWCDIPSLAIVTGKNGCGKTQLLQLIGSTCGVYPSIVPGPEINGLSTTNASSLLLDSSFEPLVVPENINVNEHQQRLLEGWHRFNSTRKNPADLSKDPELSAISRKIELAGLDIGSVSQDDFFRIGLPFVSANGNSHRHLPAHRLFTPKLAERFISYYLRCVSELVRGKSRDEFEKSHGTPPWEEVDELMIAAELKFRVWNPEEHGLETPYRLRLVERATNNPVNFNEISSGERLLVTLVLWLFHLREQTVPVQLLLLDEPDAHLHPELTPHLLRVLQSKLIAEYGIRVVMTTQRPTTVALAPKESVFEMTSNPTAIRPTQSVTQTLQLLTASLLDVGRSVRVVIVEDEDDRKFYQSAFHHCVYEHILNDNQNLVFVSAGQRNRNQTSGGCNEVRKWSPRLREAGLDQIVGLVDKDAGQSQEHGVFILPRICMENYLVDPLLIFAVLVDNEQSPQFDGISIPAGRSHEIKSLPESQLQRIVDCVFDRLKVRIGKFGESTEGEEVVFCTGTHLTYPAWFGTTNGKLILGAAHEVFGADIVNASSLRNAFARLGMIPSTLQELFSNIQQLKFESDEVTASSAQEELGQLKSRPMTADT